MQRFIGRTHRTQPIVVVTAKIHYSATGRYIAVHKGKTLLSSHEKAAASKQCFSPGDPVGVSAPKVFVCGHISTLCLARTKVSASRKKEVFSINRMACAGILGTAKHSAKHSCMLTVDANAPSSKVLNALKDQCILAKDCSPGPAMVTLFCSCTYSPSANILVVI